MKTKRHAVCAALAALGGFVAVFADGAGGVVTNEMPDGSTLYTFKESGTFVPPAGGFAEVLLVGGGGGGSREVYYGGGAGGGAGGVLVMHEVPIVAGREYAVVVGAGGAPGENGGDSSAFNGTACGGGAGGNGAQSKTATGSDGGSGGGGCGRYRDDNVYGGGAGVSGQGNAGGSGTKYDPSTTAISGGGGGAGAVGGDADVDGKKAGSGGDGISFLQFNAFGTNVWYCGGGGAGGSVNKSIPVGFGGKGGGANGNNSGEGFDGAPNTGGGGGGGSYSYDGSAWRTYGGGSGGSGVVVIRAYPQCVFTSSRLADGSTVFTITKSGAFPMPMKGEVEVFLVGGGGGGGGNPIKELATGQQTAVGYDSRAGGGGGGGGVVHETGVAVSARDYLVVVGAGGAQNCMGQNTMAFGLEALGGGSGGTSKVDPMSGGSGGGAGSKSGNRAVFVGAESANPLQGHAGGMAYTLAYNNQGGGGGGGGAGGPGGNGWTETANGDGTITTNRVAGSAGCGVVCPFLSNGVMYGAGGKGGISDYSHNNAPDNCGADGAPNTGMGGDGGRSYVHVSAGHGGAGGSGIVIIRCFLPPKGLNITIR